jgi:hypothetical protein
MKPYEKDRIIEYYIGVSEATDKKIDAINAKLDHVITQCNKNETDIKWLKKIGATISSIGSAVIIWIITGVK